MIKKIILVNIVIIIFVLGIIEFLSLHAIKNKYAEQTEIQIKNSVNKEEVRKLTEVKYHKVKKFVYEERIQKCLARVFKGNKKGSIITMGCSYTDGAGLQENQTFAYKLNKLTDRTTYNRGVGASGPQLVYRQLSDKNFKNEIPEADYIIYTFIYDHFNRLAHNLVAYFNSDLHLNYYINNKGELAEVQYPFWFLYYFYTTKVISEYREFLYLQQFDKRYKLFLKIMEESVKAMKKNYPNAKFILLEFPEARMCKKDYIKGESELTKEQIKDIEKLGIIYINAEELVGHPFRDIEKYRLPDKDHPNERVWDEIVPALAKKLNL